MRPAIVLGLLVVAAGVSGPLAQASLSDSLSCAASLAGTPPCGPIPVIITITLEKSKGLKFDASNKFETSGKVQYYFDINDNGYAYDPTKPEKVTLKVNKQPPWLKTSIEPTEADIPLESPTNVVQDGATDQYAFTYEFPIKVKVEKLREPTHDELVKWTKSDGTYRASFSATSNDNMAGTDATGYPAGLMEGYGVKELRFVSSAESAFSAPSAKADAAGLGPAGFLVALGAAMALVAMRRRLV